MLPSAASKLVPQRRRISRRPRNRWIAMGGLAVLMFSPLAPAEESESSDVKSTEIHVVGGANQVDSQLPDLPQSLTSFGAARLGDRLYVYGGHTGTAHSYSIAEQSNRFYSLDLNKPKQWNELAAGPRLQGLALVAHDEAIYRLGGFTARNEEGEDQDLHSQDSFAKFDPATGVWTDLTPLPEPRSSFDAAVLDGRLYVFGGWSMQGDRDTQWHQTGWSIDLANPSGAWQPVTRPPFQRRAVAVAPFQGKLYVIGGMQSDGKMTSRVDIYDPESKTWTTGPNLEGEDANGFGSAAATLNGRLYVSTIRGHLQRLSEDGDRWEVMCQIEPARFFHQMLPRDDGSLLLIGGANMSIGKFTELDEIEIR